MTLQIGKEPREKRDSFKGHHPRLGAKGDVPVVHRNQTCVGDSDPVGIAAKITNDLFRAPEGALGVDDPA